MSVKRSKNWVPLLSLSKSYFLGLKRRTCMWRTISDRSELSAIHCCKDRWAPEVTRRKWIRCIAQCLLTGTHIFVRCRIEIIHGCPWIQTLCYGFTDWFLRYISQRFDYQAITVDSDCDDLQGDHSIRVVSTFQAEESIYWSKSRKIARKGSYLLRKQNDDVTSSTVLNHLDTSYTFIVVAWSTSAWWQFIIGRYTQFDE